MAIYNTGTNRTVEICLDNNGTLTIYWDGNLVDTFPNWNGNAVTGYIQDDFSGHCNTTAASVAITVTATGVGNMVDVGIDITDCVSTNSGGLNGGEYKEEFTINLDPGTNCSI